MDMNASNRMGSKHADDIGTRIGGNGQFVSEVATPDCAVSPKESNKHARRSEKTAALDIDWSAWPGLRATDIALLVGLDREEADGRWGAVGVYLHLLSKQEARLRSRAGERVTEYIAAARMRRKEHLNSYLRRWPRLTANQACVLNVLDMCEERGDWRGVRTLLDATYASLTQICDPQAVEQVDRVRRRLLDAETFEAENGLGSLLQREHPWFSWTAQARSSLASCR